MKGKQPDQDSPWKEVLERYFEQFLAFFFPVAHTAIDWSKPHIFLDKELQKVVRDAALGRRLVDKLVQVHTREGAEAWVLAHIEVHGDEDPELPKRMYVPPRSQAPAWERGGGSIATTAAWPVSRC